MADLGLQRSPVMPPAELVLRRLSKLAPLSAEAEALICGLDEVQPWSAGTELVADRERLTRPMFLTSGWAARIHFLPDGRRQIVNLVLPGDPISVCFRPCPRALCPVVALTEVQTLAAGPFQKALAANTELGVGLSEVSEIVASLDEANLIDQIVRLGRQTAYERLCHLFLELNHRLEAVGLAEANRFRMPLTQDALADATGLSTVHVNRVLQQQRRDRLLELSRGWLTFLDLDLAAALADYRAPEPSWSADRLKAISPRAAWSSGSTPHCRRS
jgi:CRP-like cAMP-binding protein